MSAPVLAKALGYASIGCWLCAQLPQVIKNARLQSCEGLALPFLVNWLFGDITNLVGCLLTDQLPFQKYLAAYFCIVDFTLCGQYFYYRRPSKAPSIHPVVVYPYTSSPRQSFLITRPTSHPGHSRTRSTSTLPATAGPSTGAGPSRPRIRRGPYSAVHPPQSSTNDLTSPPLQTPLPVDGSYAAIYEAALDVARAAERANIRRNQSRSRIRRAREDDGHIQGHIHQDGGITEEEDYNARGAPGRMFESFHSELSNLSHNTTSTAREEEDRDRRNMSMSVPMLDGRGRTLQRTATSITHQTQEERDRLEPLEESVLDMRETRRSKSRSLSIARGSSGRGKGRRAAGVAFMSLVMLFRLGLGATGHGASRGGTVISRRHTKNFLATAISFLSDVPPDTAIDYQRVIGRISAWACCTLYLTSRLPQIWKNFERKSVEGLSILLFFFAFAGNLTYVFSILLDPAGNGDPSEINHYLLEALPYLLGSGGTLLFDMTIMFQSWMYGSSPPVDHIRGKGKLWRRRANNRSVEDGRGVSAGMSVSVSSERQPLLSGSMVFTPMTSRDQSPDVMLRTGGEVRGGHNNASRVLQGVPFVEEVES